MSPPSCRQPTADVNLKKRIEGDAVGDVESVIAALSNLKKRIEGIAWARLMDVIKIARESQKED